MLLLKLLADVPRRLLLPREELLGIHSHAITRQGKSPTQGVPAEENLVRGQTARSGGVMMGLQSRPHLLEPVPTWIVMWILRSFSNSCRPATSARPLDRLR